MDVSDGVGQLDEEIAPGPAERADVADRLVFFFSGFDPKGATFYHRLFRTGAGRRNATHEETLQVGPRQPVGSWASAWSVLWQAAPRPGDGAPSGSSPAADDGAPAGSVRTRMHFMRWDDLVRQHWRRGPLQLARDYWNVYARGIAGGVFARVHRQAPAAFWLALFPLGVAAGCLLGGLLLAGGALAALGLPAGLAALAGLAAGAVVWRIVARRIDCEWLLRLYAFTRLQAIGELPALDARQDEMADHVVAAVGERLRRADAPPLREVLFVGYSTGSTMAAAVAARALDRLLPLVGKPGAPPDALAIVTLGHCVPVAADWSAARVTRAELAQLADCPALTWHDYSSPADWAAFSRTPPWPEPARLRGRQASPRFHAQLPQDDYAALRRDRREMHLQYLRPPARRLEADAYDYFALTCGPRTLAERHAAPARGAREAAP